MIITVVCTGSTKNRPHEQRRIGEFHVQTLLDGTIAVTQSKGSIDRRDPVYSESFGELPDRRVVWYLPCPFAGCRRHDRRSAAWMGAKLATARQHSLKVVNLSLLPE